MRRYGLVGKSLGHSFSRGFFQEKFRRLQLLDCRYENFELPEPAKGFAALKADRSICGLNVTIPYKNAVLEHADELSAVCSTIGASNCIQIKNGRWIAHNTDVIGFEKSFTSLLNLRRSKALVLGTGGAAAAVKYVLNRLKMDFLQVSRRSGDGVITYEDVDETILKEYLVIINTTPLGTFPAVDAGPALPYSALTPEHYLYDLIYNPEKTFFLRQGEMMGAAIKNGLEMLEIQAEESWRIWNS